MAQLKENRFEDTETWAGIMAVYVYVYVCVCVDACVCGFIYMIDSNTYFGN